MIQYPVRAIYGYYFLGLKLKQSALYRFIEIQGDKGIVEYITLLSDEEHYTLLRYGYIPT